LAAAEEEVSHSEANSTMMKVVIHSVWVAEEAHLKR